jgi:hypothetical protein
MRLARSVQGTNELMLIIGAHDDRPHTSSLQLTQQTIGDVTTGVAEDANSHLPPRVNKTEEVRLLRALFLLLRSAFPVPSVGYLEEPKLRGTLECSPDSVAPPIIVGSKARNTNPSRI